MTHRSLVSGLIITALLTLSTATSASAQVCASLILTTQAEVDVVSCTSVTGEIRIQGSDITNLNGLGDITSVGGNLIIIEADGLTNLDGLGGITSVGENLLILFNDVLTNVDGLGGITSVGGNLEIASNIVLTNLDGLGGITSVGGDLGINTSDSLTSLDGLGGITSVGRDLDISFNDVLTNLDGLGGITSVGRDLDIRLNDVLTNVDGLGGITSVGAGLFISNNAVLTNVDGLGGITSVGENLRITFNVSLDNFCGLYPLLDASGLVVGAYTVTGNATNPTEAEILAGGPCPPSSAQAVMLDNFEEGAFALFTTPGATFDEATQSGLSVVNVLSGERIVLLDFLGSTNNPGASSSELVLTGGDDAASFTADSELGKRLEVIYSFAAPVNLTAMGSAFSIELESLLDSAGAFSFLVGVESTGGNESNVEVSGLTPGTITVPFSTLVGVADLSQADRIFFQLRTTDGAFGSMSATIDDFQIVPEPGSGLLQLTAMLVVAGLRRLRA